MSAVAVAQRYRGPADLFSPVIVRDMWLTGVDTPSLCPMYMGKPMRGEAPNRVAREIALPGPHTTEHAGPH
jgi:hypothetical protein